MLKDILLPEIAENVEGGIVSNVMVAVGDRVSREQPLLEIESEKAAFEVPCPEEGRIEEITVKVGDEVKVGQLLMKLQTEPAQKPQPAPQAPAGESRQAEEPVMAEQPQPAAGEPEPVTPAVETEEPVHASPAVRREARELGVDINQVSGSGPAGHVTMEDVRMFARKVITTSNATATQTRPRPGVQTALILPDFGKWGPIHTEPMTTVRRMTAESLSSSWAEIPQVSQFHEADATELEAYRANFSQRNGTENIKVTLTALLVKIVASALHLYPKFNASLNLPAREIIYKKYIHMAVAVDTSRGLLVPVIRDVDNKSLLEVARELSELAQAARSKQIGVEQMQGGTFTISNLGGIGGTQFTPLVNHPQVAILGVSRFQKKLRYVNGQPTSRLLLPLSLSYDHRIIDGAEGARFLQWIVQAIENPLMAALGGGVRWNIQHD